MSAPLSDLVLDLKMNKKLQTVIVFVVGLVAMAVGYAVLKM